MSNPSSQCEPIAVTGPAFRLPQRVLPWVLSAQTTQSLRGQAALLAAHVAGHEELVPADVAYSLATTRPDFPHRAVVLAAGRDDFQRRLSALASGEPAPGVIQGSVRPRRRVAFLFPGEGGQRPGMGRELYQAFGVFADLRRAKGHTLFGCSNEIGLSDCLASGLAFPAALKSHPRIATLFLLPAGSHVLNPSELLGSRRFADLLAELRPHFDYIFIDTPPLLLVTDAQLISPLADGCVLVLRAHKTSKQCLRRSLALMRATKTPMFGLVMNAFKTQMSSYSGDGYYGKGSGYYAEG